jgi:hypothetical protein
VKVNNCLRVKGQMCTVIDLQVMLRFVSVIRTSLVLNLLSYLGRVTFNYNLHCL